MIISLDQIETLRYGNALWNALESVSQKEKGFHLIKWYKAGFVASFATTAGSHWHIDSVVMRFRHKPFFYSAYSITVILSH